jgi:hypothetical protein
VLKAKPGVDVNFRRFVRAHGCEVAANHGTTDYCKGVAEFAHTNHRGMGGKHVPDVGNGVCLCTKHHTGEIHLVGQRIFEEKYDLDLNARAAKYAEWYRDGKPFLEE